MKPSIVIAGREAERMGYGKVDVDEIAWKFSTPGTGGGGFQSVKFRLALPGNGFHSQLQAGAPVLVRMAGWPLGWGRIDDGFDKRTGEVIVNGDFMRADRFNAEGLTNVRGVVVAANARGMGWNGYGNLPNSSVNTTDEDRVQLTTVADVLNTYCQQQNKCWYLTAENVPMIVDPPSTVTHNLRPGVAAMRSVEGNYITRYAVRYALRVQTEVTGWGPDEEYATADDDLGETKVLEYGYAAAEIDPLPEGVTQYEDFEDISDLGLLTEPAYSDFFQQTSETIGAEPKRYWIFRSNEAEAQEAAEIYAGQVLAARGPRKWFMESVQAGGWQVTNLGGKSPALWVPLHGARIRHYGVLSDSIGTPQFGRTLEWTVGRCVWRPADGTRVLEPTELSPRASLKRAMGWRDDPRNPQNKKTA